MICPDWYSYSTAPLAPPTMTSGQQNELARKVELINATMVQELAAVCLICHVNPTVPTTMRDQRMQNSGHSMEIRIMMHPVLFACRSICITIYHSSFRFSNKNTAENQTSDATYLATQGNSSAFLLHPSVVILCSRIYLPSSRESFPIGSARQSKSCSD